MEAEDAQHVEDLACYRENNNENLENIVDKQLQQLAYELDFTEINIQSLEDHASGETIIDAILDNKDLAACLLSPKSLLYLNEKRPGILIDIFSDEIDDKGTMKINFRGNNFAKNNLGYFWISPGISEIEITNPNGDKIYATRDTLSGAFYRKKNKEYVPMINGATIQIKQTRNISQAAINQEIQDLMQEHSDFFENTLQNETPEYIEFAKKVFEVSLLHGIDPYLMIKIMDNVYFDAKQQKFGERGALELIANDINRMLIRYKKEIHPKRTLTAEQERENFSKYYLRFSRLFGRDNFKSTEIKGNNSFAQFQKYLKESVLYAIPQEEWESYLLQNYGTADLSKIFDEEATKINHQFRHEKLKKIVSIPTLEQILTDEDHEQYPEKLADLALTDQELITVYRAFSGIYFTETTDNYPKKGYATLGMPTRLVHIKGIKGIEGTQIELANAIGRHQFFGNRWVEFSQQAFGRGVHLPDPLSQDKVAFYMLCKYFKQHKDLYPKMMQNEQTAIRLLAADWYGYGIKNPPFEKRTLELISKKGVKQLNRQESTDMSPWEYTDRVITRGIHPPQKLKKPA